VYIVDDSNCGILYSVSDEIEKGTVKHRIVLIVRSVRGFSSNRAPCTAEQSLRDYENTVFFRARQRGKMQLPQSLSTMPGDSPNALYFPL